MITCDGPASTDCLSCYDTFTMDGGSCKCDNDYYFDSTDITYSSIGACKKCPNYYGNNKGLSSICFACHYSWFQIIILYLFKVWLAMSRLKLAIVWHVMNKIIGQKWLKKIKHIANVQRVLWREWIMLEMQ